MGGVTYYKTAQDGYLARAKGGVDADRIRNDPNFARTRENGAEFGRAGAAARLLRQAFRALIINNADSRMSSRLTKEMVRVIKADATSLRGARNVIDGEAELLEGFEFNQNGRLTQTFYAPFAPAIDRAGGTLGVSVPAFVSGNMIAAPGGATHFRLVTAGAEIDFETGEYVVNTAQSAELEISPVQTPALALENLVTPGSTRPLFLVFGIEFLQRVNGQMYPLKNGAYNALSVVAVSGATG
jgi:hypothetical protein